jgi:hypothetical protein
VSQHCTIAPTPRFHCGLCRRWISGYPAAHAYEPDGPRIDDLCPDCSGWRREMYAMFAPVAGDSRLEVARA